MEVQDKGHGTRIWFCISYTKGSMIIFLIKCPSYNKILTFFLIYVEKNVIFNLYKIIMYTILIFIIKSQKCI